MAKSTAGTAASRMHMPSFWQLGAATWQKQDHLMQAARQDADASLLPAVCLSALPPSGVSALRALSRDVRNVSLTAARSSLQRFPPMAGLRIGAMWPWGGRREIQPRLTRHVLRILPGLDGRHLLHGCLIRLVKVLQPLQAWLSGRASASWSSHMVTISLAGSRWHARVAGQSAEA